MGTARQFWRASWIGIFLIGLGILFCIDNLPQFKEQDLFFPGLLGVLMLVGGMIRWSSRTTP